MDEGRGNELADAFAGKGALLHEVPVDIVDAVRETDPRSGDPFEL